MSEATPDTTPETVAPPRPSRQDLVVPPRQSSLSAIVGACLCAAAGFGLVWAFGIGRDSRPVSDDDQAPPSMARADAEPEALPPDDASAAARPREPDMLPVIEDARPARPDRSDPSWPSRPARHDAPEDSVDQYPVHATSLDMPEPVVPASGDISPPPRFSRFAPAAADDVPEGVTTTSATSEALPVEGTLPESTGSAPERPAFPTTTAIDPPSPESPVSSEATAITSPDLPPPTAPVPEDTGDLAAPTPPPSAPAPLPVAPPPAAAAFGAAPPSFQTPPAPMPPQPPAAFVAAPADMPATSPPRPAAPPAIPVSAASPFAAAPPVLSDSLAGADPEPGPTAGTSPKAPPVAGVGRPGPMQLEGVQTPQVSVEKRGPREVSVGKHARYEIVVRNVGSATAHEVVLRDAVPQGTALVATTPPASPVTQASGEADDALVWSLGTLPPGGQALVTMEVMPQVEGEIGSVASVSFRTDASVRSRATKPDLRIECTPPEPVLIGRDLQMTITITNPGTGVATGVVLEGFLPDNVSHRSGRELEFDVGQLRPGESRTIDLVLGTRGPGIHAARLTARADGGVDVVEQIPIEVTAPTLELAVDMPLRRFLQRPATCTIAMTNAGTAPARSVELAAQLPPGMKFVKANNAGWHDDRTHRVLWNLEELPAGETGTVQVVVMPVELGPQKIVAAARSADGLADQVAHTCDVEGLAALSFEVIDSEDPIEVDGVTEYVVRVGNQGTKPATGVRLAATLLGDLEPVEAQGPGGHRVDNLTVSFEPLAKLAPAEEAVFRIRAKGRRAGDQRIQVQLTSADHPAPITKEEITRVYADR